VITGHVASCIRIPNVIYVATNRNLTKTKERMSHIKNRAMDQEIFAFSKGRKNPFLGKRGTVAILVGLSAPALVLAIGLGIEASGWSAVQQRLQRTADMAALAGALAYNKGASVSVAATQAAYAAEINGSTGVTSPATRTWLPTPKTLLDGSITIQEVNGVKNAGDIAFAATIQDTVPLLFSAIALPGPGITLSATGIAELVSGGVGKYCVLVLDPNAETAASINNGATVNATTCGVDINATGSASLAMTGGATLDAANVGTSSATAPCGMSGTGTFSCGQGATMVVTKSSTTNASPGINPYGTVPMPTPSTTCASGSPFIAGQTIPAGTYCNGLVVSFGTVTMAPGVIIVEGGDFHPTGGSTVNATSGTTIVLTGSSSSNIANAQIDNGVTLNLTAPSSLTMATRGIAIMQDSRASATAVSNIAGGASINVVGALDFPHSTVNFSNGSTNNASCTQLIAYQVQFVGGANFSNNCTGAGTSPIGASTTAVLVE
jgi:hypothetical protein